MFVKNESLVLLSSSRENAKVAEETCSSVGGSIASLRKDPELQIAKSILLEVYGKSEFFIVLFLVNILHVQRL